MNIIVLTHTPNGTRRRSIHSGLHFALLGLVAALVIGAAGYSGYHLGQWREGHGQVARWRAQLDSQQEQVEEIRRDAQAEVAALTARLAELQSRVTRLDALGRKLIDVSRLDAEEFDFDSVPGVGGPAAANAEDWRMSELEAAIDNLANRIQDRERQLTVLDGVLEDREITAATTPAGRPIVKGWLSSPYGYRKDPFTGKKAWHAGIDFAGADGSAVVAVAGGVVTHAGKRWGYGRLVEITHGDGYVTRYGHGKKILVEEGQIVRRGDQIAEMGSSGRSTGPHVHLEVLKNGEPINPWKFVQAER